ncbi:MAG: transposase [Armatimonadetes bacterium]|nr:transposase [Armatimonadota bacterium]
MNKGNRYTEDQIIKVLKEIEGGATVAGVARSHGISEQTLYRWRERYGGMTKSELAELRALQEENPPPEGDRGQQGNGHRGLQGGSEGKMVSPAPRKSVCASLLKAGHSRVRACRVARLSRPASRAKKRDRNPELRARVLELAKKYPRFGFRRIHLLLPGVNRKAVHRIWREEGLRLSRRRRKRLKVASSAPMELTGTNQALVYGLRLADS